MSPNVGNFVHDLVEMAKATERLPELEAELNHTKSQLEATQKHVERLEISLRDRRTEIENCASTIRDLEVARDDAELRFLELDEKAHKALSWLSDIESATVNIRGHLEVKPEPKPEPVKEQSYEEAHPKPFEPSNEQRDQSEPNPPQLEEHSATEPLGDNYSKSSVSASHETSGQSDSHPIQSTHSVSTTDAHADTTIPIAPPTDPVASTDSLRPYAGKRYVDVPGYISRADWLAGGGTDDSYDFHY